MKYSVKIISIFCIGVLGIFGVWEFLKQRNDTVIYTDIDIVFLKIGPQQIFSFGERESSIARILLSSLKSFFSPEAIPLESFQNDGWVGQKDIKIRFFSENMVYIQKQNQRIWFLDDPTEEEKKSIQKERISMKVDFVFLKKNINLEWFSDIKKGIIFFGDRNISKKLKYFAQENSIPLISIKEQGIISLTWKNGGWILKTVK